MPYHIVSRAVRYADRAALEVLWNMHTSAVFNQVLKSVWFFFKRKEAGNRSVFCLFTYSLKVIY